MVLSLVGWVACSFTPMTDGGWVDTGVSVEDTAMPTDHDGSAPEPEESDVIEGMDSSALPAGPSPCRTPVLGRVTDVTDGDTIKVETGRGIERVRLIGIDTPEVDHSGPDDECFGEEATLFLSEKIEDKRVWLTFDFECDDHYDRTLAYLHTETEFIQRSLLQAGMATAYVVSPNDSLSSLFSADESAAQAEDVGLWGECP